MIDREKVIKGLAEIIEYFFDIYRNDTDSYKCEKAQEYSDCAIDALAMLKEQEAVEPQDAEMLIIHNGGAEEYVKDIESIVLLAHKDYDIVYCGTFGRSVKRNDKK